MALWFVLGCLCGPQAEAVTLALPPPGEDVVGEITTVQVAEDDTLLDIARRHGLGYREIVAANPDLDPWLPPPGADVTLATRYILPSVRLRGIVINIPEMRLYYFPPPVDGSAGVVMTYPIGIGQEGWSTPVARTRVLDKIKDPAWTIPESIRLQAAAEGKVLPKVLAPGPDNPLGAYALRLGMTSYLIHGTNKPYGVGRRVSHGCIRMYPEDIAELFAHVAPGVEVAIVDQPYKAGRGAAELYFEAHEPITEEAGASAQKLSQALAAILAVTDPEERQRVEESVLHVARQHSGLPARVAAFREEPAAPLEGWVLQLGAFSRIENATRLAAAVRDLALPVSIQARVNDGFCHVLVGPYDNPEVAAKALADLVQRTGYGGKLLPADRHGLLASCVP